MNKFSSPLVSVCVVAYNQVEYIEYCINSIIRQITNFEFEIIVGDDCSTDGTYEVLTRMQTANNGRFQIVKHNKNVGWTENMLSLYRLARGTYIAHMDGDDAMLTGKLQAQVDFFTKNPECSIVGHDARVIDAKNMIVKESWANGPTKSIYTLNELVIAGTFFTHSSKMFKKSSMISQSRDRPTVDFYFHIEHALSGLIGYINKSLCEYRVVSGISSIGGKHKIQVLIAHLDAYQLARNSGVPLNIVETAEQNFRYVQGMIALRAGRLDLYTYMFSDAAVSVRLFSRKTIFLWLAKYPKVAYAILRVFDRLRGR